jgi:GAF domain-containing protein
MADISRREPTEAFARLGRINLSETDLNGVFEQVAGAAKRTIPGAREASVTLVRPAGAYTAAFTGALALELDESQYQLGHGPCLDAASSDTVIAVVDMASENRWPAWTSRAVEAGAHSSLSIGLPVQQTLTGALNMYATEPHAFDDGAVAIARTFAGYAAIAMANAYVYDATMTLAQHLKAAMESSAVIEQAKGIIMVERRCTAEEAFAVLSKISQDSNRKVRDIAAGMVARAVAPKP